MVAELGHLPRLALIRAPRSRRNLGVEVEHLFGSEWALEATFAGSHCRQIFLQLVQRTQRRTAWTEIEKWTELFSNFRRGLTTCKQTMMRTRRELHNVYRA